ncbi:MAG: glycine cleavage system protein H [Acidobacteriota bacterium]
MAHSTHHIIPEGERYCIWMEAGVVDYKLCNAGFLCETCAFDAQIRTEKRRADDGTPGQPSPDTGAIESSGAADACWESALRSLLGAIGSQRLPLDRTYAGNHTWAKKEEDGTYVLGVDHFIGALLPGMQSVACTVVPASIRANEPFAWIVAGGETLAVRSPVAGRLTAGNPLLAERTSLIRTDPYAAGWIARVVPESDHAAMHLADGAAFQAALERDMARFERSIRSKFRRLEPAALRTLTPTMYDGGMALANFEDMLGARKYYSVVEQFLRSRS